MNRVKSKYPIKIGNTLVAAGIDGTVMILDDCPTLKVAFPNMRLNPESQWVIIQFEGCQPCIVHMNQLAGLVPSAAGAQKTRRAS